MLKLGKFIGKRVTRGLKHTYGDSLERIIANSFKITLAISVILVVLFFRLYNPYGFKDKYINAMEFVSSVIVIPIILEWLFSGKKGLDS